MKEMNEEKRKMWEAVVFSFSEDEILRELTAESSYVAKSVASTTELQPGWSRSIIVTEDDRPFLDRWLSDARDEMTRVLSAYLSGEIASTDSRVVFAVVLPEHRAQGLDESICHQLERAIVHYVLAQWFVTKLPDESARRQLQYQGALEAVKSDIRLARNRRPHRPTNYF